MIAKKSRGKLKQGRSVGKEKQRESKEACRHKVVHNRAQVRG